LHVPPKRGINVVTAIAAKGKTNRMTTSIPQEQTKAPAIATVKGAPRAKKAGVAKRRAHVAPSKAKSARTATPAKKPTTARGGSKTAKILALLRRPDGATLKELRKATGWQPHSVRGFLSGAIGKKMGIPVESFRSADGERGYRTSSK
jgi:transposase